MTRFFDLLLSIVGLILLSPVFVFIAIGIVIDAPGKVLYKQMRIGKNGVAFRMMKFRTMYDRSDRNGFLTVGAGDKRITAFGGKLRKYKLDELPQLFNVIKGDMSIVGPRPEVKQYVDLYTEEQRAVLSVLPGISDFASIAYSNESELLATQNEPEAYYIKYIMPEKIRLNQRFIQSPSVTNYFKVIFLTVKKVLSK